MRYLGLRLSAAMWARVLLLWLMLAVATIVVGAVAIGLGRFMQDNVRAELVAQAITFNPVENLSDEEKALPGIVDNAGQQLTTGAQAQAWAGLIGLHMSEAAASAGYPGATYASLGGIQRQLRADVATATEAGDTAAADAANATLTAVNNLRTTLLTGNTLRGTLLSAYGWDNVATGLQTAGTVAIVLALIFVVLFIYELWRGHLPAPTEEHKEQ